MSKFMSLLSAVCLSAVVSNCVAIEGKIAYVDMEKVFATRIVTNKADALKEEFEKKHKRYQDAQQSFEKEVAKYQKNASSMTQSVKTGTEEELRRKSVQLTQQGNEMQQEFMKRQNEIRQEYVAQSERISKELAKEYNLDVIYPKHTLLYGDQALDLTEMLIRRLK